MNIGNAIAGVIVMGIGALTTLGMFIAGTISIITVAREKRAERKAKKETEES